MNYLRKFFTTLLFMLLIFSNVEAQVNPVYKIMRKRGWVPQPINNKTKLTPDQVNEKFLISMGYNDTTISKLQKVGVDLLKLYGRHWEIKNLTAISDCIVIGTVTSKEYPLLKSVFYHTIAHIQVEEFIRNDYNLPKSQVLVMIESGPTGVPGERGIRIGEDTLRIGEHVFLFLSANGLLRMSNDSHMQKLYEKLINDPIIRFKITAKYDIENGKIIGRNGVKNLAEVKDDINTVMKAIR